MRRRGDDHVYVVDVLRQPDVLVLVTLPAAPLEVHLLEGGRGEWEWRRKEEVDVEEAHLDLVAE